MKTKDWEIRFDNDFFGTDRSPDVSIENEAVYVYAVKKFINSLLLAQREEIIQLLKNEMISKDVFDKEVVGYNFGLKEGIRLIK